MSETSSSYRAHRFPAEIISHAISLYYRFGLSIRDVVLIGVSALSKL